MVCAVARFAWDDAMTHVVLRPFAVAQGPRNYSASPYFAPEPDTPIRLMYYLDGEPSYGDVYQWYADHDPVRDRRSRPVDFAGTVLVTEPQPQVRRAPRAWCWPPCDPGQLVLERGYGRIRPPARRLGYCDRRWVGLDESPPALLTPLSRGRGIRADLKSGTSCAALRSQTNARPLAGQVAKSRQCMGGEPT